MSLDMSVQTVAEAITTQEILCDLFDEYVRFDEDSENTKEKIFTLFVQQGEESMHILVEEVRRLRRELTELRLTLSSRETA